ncbi:hypothetical protein Tco_1235478, partial [Tanacetum coccineum]
GIWTLDALSVVSVSVKKLHGYGHLYEIVVRRADLQHKLFQLDDSAIVDLIMALRMFIRSLIINLRVGDLHLGVEKKSDAADELYKFSDRTLKTIRDELYNRKLNYYLGYNKEMSRRKWTTIDKRRSKLMVEIIDKQM